MKNKLYESTYGNVNLKNKNLIKQIKDINEIKNYNKVIEHKIFYILYLEEINNLINNKNLESFKKIEHFINKNNNLNSFSYCDFFYISVLNEEKNNIFNEYNKKIIEIEKRYFDFFVIFHNSINVGYEYRLKEEVINELKLNEVLNKEVKQKKVRI